MICGCGKKMTQGGSDDYSDVYPEDLDDWLIINNYSCPDCNTLVFEYVPPTTYMIQEMRKEDDE